MKTLLGIIILFTLAGCSLLPKNAAPQASKTSPPETPTITANPAPICPISAQRPNWKTTSG